MLIVTVIGIVITIAFIISVLIYMKAISPATRIVIGIIGVISVILQILNFFYPVASPGTIILIIAVMALAYRSYHFYVDKAKSERQREES